MLAKVRYSLVAALLALFGWTARMPAQPPGLPPAPVPVVPASPPGEARQEALPRPFPDVPPGPPASLPPPPVYVPYPETRGPVLHGDYLFDTPASGCGWFTSFDIEFVGAHLNNHLQNTVTVPGFQPDLVQLPIAGLDWTGSPQIQIGYRLPEGLGEVLVSYRFLTTEGTDTLIGFDLDGGDVELKSRLDVNVLDFDYVSREYSLAPHWAMKWALGGRFATVFFDSRAEGLFLDQRTSNNFVGGGPQAAVAFWRTLGMTRLGLFGRLEGSGIVGQIRQGFEEVFMTSDGSFVGAATAVHHTQVVPTLNVQAGLSWTPWRFSRFIIGYEFEHWWELGNAAGSRADLTTNGIFFRGEFGF